MAQVHWRLLEFPQRLKARVLKRLECVRVTYMSLCYNHFTSWNTVMDALFEPLFWIVDHSARYMGPIMVTLVVLLTTMVVVVFYVCIFPHIFYQTDMFWSLVHMVFSHWVLMNIVFNYTMAVFTKPGNPPQNVFEVVSICKKCISPKPPRTHHCSVCGNCVLKMDHHCPWLNNCVGFYNHRYFLLFVFYMWLGTVYVSIAGYDVFKQHFFGNQDLIVPAFFFPINLAYKAWNEASNKMNKWSTSHNSSASREPTHIDEEIKATLEDQLFHNAVIIQFLLCAGVTIALGLLLVWHVRLISFGQTSIEQHINKKERARLRKKNLRFKNPYDFGVIQNWRMFLGLDNGKSFFLHVLLPSRHDPKGDGLSWETATFTLDRHNLEVL